MNILITICARGGSKGIPGKNIKLLNGIALIAYTIQIAERFKLLYSSDIALSTDDDQIKEVAASFGLETTYRRPANLALDSSGKIETIIDLLLYYEDLNNKKYDYVLDLDVTSPLRTLQDLEDAFNIIKTDEHAYNLFSVNHANRNPYFNMVEKKDNGYFGLAKTGSFLSRQAAPAVYDMNASFYFFKRFFFDSGLTTSTTHRSLIYVMPHICFDLDHPIDFEFMEYLLVNNRLDFKF